MRSRLVWINGCPNDTGEVRGEIGRVGASDAEIGDIGVIPVKRWGQI